MAKGGARANAGRKPANVETFTPKVVRSTDPLLSPPDDLADAQRAVWVRLAEHSIANGTLTAATVEGFRYLCEVTAKCGALEARIDADGWTFQKVTVDGAGQEQIEDKRHPLWGTLAALMLRREAGLVKYGLIANGKPVASKPVAENPWAKLS